MFIKTNKYCVCDCGIVSPAQCVVVWHKSPQTFTTWRTSLFHWTDQRRGSSSIPDVAARRGCGEFDTCNISASSFSLFLLQLSSFPAISLTSLSHFLLPYSLFSTLLSLHSSHRLEKLKHHPRLSLFELRLIHQAEGSDASEHKDVG